MKKKEHIKTNKQTNLIFSQKFDQNYETAETQRKMCYTVTSLAVRTKYTEIHRLGFAHAAHGIVN